MPMKPLSGLFTLSYHSHPHKKNHLDLFLQLSPGKKLITYHIAPGQKEGEVTGVRGEDHRALYLNFEGAISRGRGKIKILKQGIFIAPPELLEKGGPQKVKMTCQTTEIIDITHSMWKKARFETDFSTIKLYEVIEPEEGPKVPESAPKTPQEPEPVITNPGEMLLESFLQEKTIQNRYSARNTPPKIDASTLREMIRESTGTKEAPESPASKPENLPESFLPSTGEKPAEYLEVPEMVLEADGKSEKGYKK